MTRTVSLSSLTIEHPNWVNPRSTTGLSDAEVDELANDLKAKHKAGHGSGIEVPLHVQKVATINGEYINLTIDGQRRYLAANRVFPKNHQIEVIDLSDDVIELTPDKADELMLRALAIGSKREGLSAYELSEVAERLRNRGKTLLEIGNAIRKSESWVSKILKARSSATPKLMLSWRKGQVTEEQFKELASARDPERQADATDDVVKARKSGDKAEARAKSKEVKERQKIQTKRQKDAEVELERRPEVTNGAPRPKQADMWQAPPTATTEAPKKKAPSKVELEQMLDLANHRPPTHDYVKGVMDGVRHALGNLELPAFGKPWHQYISRLGGTAGKTKKVKPPRKPRAQKAKARRTEKKSRKAPRKAKR